VTLVLTPRFCEIARETVILGNRAPKLDMEIPNSSEIEKYVTAIKAGQRSDAYIYEAVQQIAHIGPADRAVP
jgi:hypothetical protein